VELQPPNVANLEVAASAATPVVALKKNETEIQLPLKHLFEYCLCQSMSDLEYLDLINIFQFLRKKQIRHRQEAAVSPAHEAKWGNHIVQI
jgi:hypothetical protein